MKLYLYSKICMTTRRVTVLAINKTHIIFVFIISEESSNAIQHRVYNYTFSTLINTLKFWSWCIYTTIHFYIYNVQLKNVTFILFIVACERWFQWRMPDGNPLEYKGLHISLWAHVSCLQCNHGNPPGDAPPASPSTHAGSQSQSAGDVAREFWTPVPSKDSDPTQ